MADMGKKKNITLLSINEDTECMHATRTINVFEFV